MDTQTFLNNLKEYADRYKKSQQGSVELFDFLDRNYEVYIKAKPEERASIRSFVKEVRYDVSQEKITYFMAHLLLIYVKERILPSLKPAKKISMLDKLRGISESPEDIVSLLRGLTAISMENRSEKFYDDTYTGNYPYGDAMLLLADLYVTAEERGMKPKKYFQQIANISSDEGIIQMNDIMASGSDTRLRAERRHFGKFEGMF